jgi:diphthamide biosynthesis enzyme Dph1/Dph2-like protein
MYDLELEKVIKTIKKEKPKTVLIQLADGLKPQATKIVDRLQKHTKAKIYISLDSCYGACDIPKTKVDLIIHFGHNDFL